MPTPAFKTAKVMEGAGATLMARVLGNAGTPITQATISSISRKTFALPDTTATTTTPSVSSLVFDALQTDARWTEDEVGYNFRDTVAASVLANGNTQYRVEYTLTPTSGEVIRFAFDLTTLEMLSD